MEEPVEKRRWQQIVYILAPFFLLLICLGFINFVPRRLAAGVTTVLPAESELAAAETAVPPTITNPPQPTSTPSPTPTLIPTATLPPDAAINLLGPPDDSRFRQLDTISFYADWPLALAESQQLAAYVRFDDQSPILLGTLEKPNIGQRYRWQINIGEMVATAVSLEWWIQLQTNGDTSPILISPTRQITLLP